MERGVGYLAIRPLARALELTPDAASVLSKLVTALEQDGQHARAVAVLEERQPVLHGQDRLQYVYNALMAGRLDKAADGFGRLPEPEDTAWRPAREKVRLMLARAGIAGRDPARSLGSARMALRPDWRCPRKPVPVRVRRSAAALQRLRLILDAAGTTLESVALLPDRSSQILGTASP